MDKDLEKTLALLAGQSAQDFESAQLSDADKMIINSAIETLYAGLSLQKWLADVSLATAWQNAMDALRDTVVAIPVENSATRYVRWAAFDYIRRMKIKMTTVGHTNEFIKCPAEKRNAWAADADSKINAGIEILRRKILEYESGYKVPVTPVLNVMAQEVVRSRNVPQQEKERERER